MSKHAPAEEKFNLERGEGLKQLFELVRNLRTCDPKLIELVQSEVKACQNFYAQNLMLDHVIEAIRANNGQQTNHLVNLYSTVCAAKIAWIQARNAEAEAHAAAQPQAQAQAQAQAQPQAQPQPVCQSPQGHVCASAAPQQAAAQVVTQAANETQPNAQAPTQNSRASVNPPDDTLAELVHQLEVVQRHINVRVAPQALTLQELQDQKKNIEEQIATRLAELKRS